jgi:hypothetical protein
MDFTHRNSGVSLSRGMSDEEKLNCLGNYWCSLVRCYVCMVLYSRFVFVQEGISDNSMHYSLDWLLDL